VARAIAIDVLGMESGQQLRPIGTYARQFEVGFGTVQSALAYLQELGALQLDARGRSGTTLTGSDLAMLWQVATDRPIIAALPSPYSRILEGLMGALREAFRRQLLNLAAVHIDGSAPRVESLLRHEADFAIISALAADIAIRDGANIAVAEELGRGSLLEKHVVLRPAGAKPLASGAVVGIDATSLEQRHICELLVDGLDVTFREVRFFEFHANLLAGEIDVAVWHSDDVITLHAPGLTIEPLPPAVTRRLAGRNSEAALVMRDDDSVMSAVLARTVEPSRMRKLQASVVRGLDRAAR
jgi:hypothetical protein